MNFVDNIKLKGILSIYKTVGDNKELIYCDENLIVLIAKQYILSAIYMVGITSDPVTSLHVGTGGTIDPQGLFPKLEDPNQTSLVTQLVTVATTYTVNNTIPSVTFIADLDTGTGNGSLISEAGLFRQSALMFNVKNFPAVPKTSDFGLHFSWTVKFA